VLEAAVLDESVLTGEAQSVQREVGTAFGALV
jgi:high-affinity K+ transport system ATPase subunit B